jgi:hypothetical protein
MANFWGNKKGISREVWDEFQRRLEKSLKEI